jgi:signal transduction histidine kinase
LTLFSTPDVAFLLGGAKVKVPFADVEILFQSFLLLAPGLLLVVTIYLHIFYGYWLDLETDYQHLSANTPSIEPLPTLFSLDHPIPRLLSAFIFYWLVPVVLGTITWRAAVSVGGSGGGGRPLALLTGLVTVMLLLLQIRRCPAFQRPWNRVRWTILGGLVVSLVVVTLMVNPEVFQRPLNIAGADLKGRSLARVNLAGTYAPGTEFQDANLQGANLRDANLQRASLQRANLQGVSLWSANLEDANLQGADLRGADLREVKDLTKAQIESAATDERTRLPDDLKRPVP